MKNQLIKLLYDYKSLDNELFENLDIDSYVDKLLEHATVICITKMGVVKAFAAYYDNDKLKNEAYLSMLIVSSDIQGFGYGKQLLTGSINDVCNQGFKTFKLEVSKNNLKAINLYKGLGFSINKEIKNSFFMIKKF